MRIIGGEWSSRRINAPAEGLRPTADRVREAVFNILVHEVDIETCTVLDLFAGSGAMGIEALSRGAQSAVFVEHNATTASIVEENLREFNAEARGTVVRSDALKYVCKNCEPADIIFADPPYAYTGIDELVACLMERSLFRRILVIEHDATLVIETYGHTPWKQRTFGATGITMFLRGDQ